MALTESEELELLELEELEANKPKLTGDPEKDMVAANAELKASKEAATPLGVFRQANIDFQKGGESGQKVAEGIASALPSVMIGGGVSRILSKPAMGAGRTLLANAAGGAAGGATMPAVNIDQFIKNTALGTGIGALLPLAASGASSGVNFLKNIPGALNQIKRNFKNIQDPARFGAEVRESLFNAKKAVGETFGNQLDELAKANPTKTVDHSTEFDRIKSAMANKEENPGLANQINAIIRRVRNPEDAKIIQKYINNPKSATNIPLEESQRIKVAIQNAPDIATKLSKGKFADYTPPDLELLDLLDNVKLSQSKVFPELAQIRKPYADFMKNYETVKNDFKQRVLLNKIRSGFGNEEINKIINTIVPDKTVKDIVGFRNAERVVSGAKKTAAAATIGAAGVGAFNRLSK